MAGGIFQLSSPKVRPGTYVNVINGKQPTAADSPRGVAMVPLIGYDWGPRDEWIYLTAESPDAGKEKFGRSIYDDQEHMILLRLLFLNATEVYAYIPGGGEKAKGEILTDTGTAEVSSKYAGELGNSLSVASVENPLGGFDVSVVLNGSEVELFEGAEDVADLAGSSYIEVAGEGNLAAFAAVSLDGGTEDAGKQNASMSKFLDMAEKIRFNCMAFPTDDQALLTALATKIKYIRNSIGWKCQAAVANMAADYEGIYNLTNSFEYEGVKLTAAQAAVWLAGAVAGASYTSSLTYAGVSGATAVLGEKSNEESILSIRAGETFFSMDEAGDVILEYDVNSKVTFSKEDPMDMNKGRPCRVYDTFANDLLVTFIPGKFDNNLEGWLVMESLGRAMLKAYEDDGAITNVSLEEDFKVDRSKSVGDSVYFIVGIQAVDSAEKYYFTVIAR